MPFKYLWRKLFIGNVSFFHLSIRQGYDAAPNPSRMRFPSNFLKERRREHEDFTENEKR